MSSSPRGTSPTVSDLSSPVDFGATCRGTWPAECRHSGLPGWRQWGVESRGRPTDARPARVPLQALPAGRESPRQGTHSAAPGHVLPARGACRGPRAKPAGRGMRACAPRPPCPHCSPGLRPPGGESGRSRGPRSGAGRTERADRWPGAARRTAAEGFPQARTPDLCWYWRPCRVEKVTGRPGPRCLLDPGQSPTPEDLKEKKEVVEEAENGRDAPANGNANEENGEQEADNEVDEEEEEGGEEEEEEEEGDGEEEDGDEDEEAESATGKRAAEDDEDDDVDTKKQKTDEDD
ncbi:prothymosin alpha isoform X2 [Gorilla gorilla gorilla]|uniref:prothymosin alpha isoform X2 n=1 Tax=Gorilla gorilla gorilla TaxID=9595 RepID=UPI0008F4C2BC|nr:prothymosin alpha isoform X2 [Gorilla gorilla gorilla]